MLRTLYCSGTGERFVRDRLLRLLDEEIENYSSAGYSDELKKDSNFAKEISGLCPAGMGEKHILYYFFELYDCLKSDDDKDLDPVMSYILYRIIENEIGYCEDCSEESEDSKDFCVEKIPKQQRSKVISELKEIINEMGYRVSVKDLIALYEDIRNYDSLIFLEDLDFLEIDHYNSLRPIMSEERIAFIISEAEAINMDRSVLAFNDPSSVYNPRAVAAYDFITDKIYVDGLTEDLEGEELPVRCILAHEYYGHRTYREEYLADKDGLLSHTWWDEARANITAAKITPNLTDNERKLLLLRAIEDAESGGGIIKEDTELFEKYGIDSPIVEKKAQR